MVVPACPNCSRPLGPPLSSGRQVCGGCGWASEGKRSPSTSSPSVYPNTLRNGLIYGLSALVALVASLALSKGSQVACERSLTTREGVCRVTEYNYLGQKKTLEAFPVSGMVTAYPHERRVRRSGRRSGSYTVYHLAIATTSGDIVTPLQSRNRQVTQEWILAVQQYQGDRIQPLLRVRDRGSPLTTAAFGMFVAAIATYKGLVYLQTKT